MDFSMILLSAPSLPIMRNRMVSKVQVSLQQPSFDIRSCLLPSMETSNKIVIRRSGNYRPPDWEYNQLQLLKNEYAVKKCIERANVLKEEVSMLLDKEDLLEQLELIDNLQRLGIYHHFGKKIQSILTEIYKTISNNTMVKGLYATALEFRLLREHGFDIPQEIFDNFKDEEGLFDAKHCSDTEGMLYLYEASYLGAESEGTLELAREFSLKQLKKNLDEKRVDGELAELVQHALDLPLHWRMPRLEARWYIDVYEKRVDMNPTLLELAKIDFNIVQAEHQNDLKYSLSWWKSTCLAEKLTFARDRMVENFFWTIGFIFEPEHGYCRRMLTEVNALVTTIDDIYDIYGTLDELKGFTDAVERWDIKAIDQLPDYMKVCYLALYNSVNEMGYGAQKAHGTDITPYLSEKWSDLCKAYLQEVYWYFSGYVPRLQEYLDNAWVSISAPLVLQHGYFLTCNHINKESIESLNIYHNIILCSSMISRLADDLATSTDEMKRGDVPKSIQCYMNETGASEEQARNHIRLLIGEYWKRMNKDQAALYHLNPTFVRMSMNLARVAQCVYRYGDGYAHSNSHSRNRILALIFEPIHI